jgi:hypothetical protein
MIVPFLFISPILTIWIPGHDVIIYLSVLYAFICLLLFNVQRLGAKWATWYVQISKVDDKAICAWYIEQKALGDEKCFDGLTNPAALRVARESLFEAVQREGKLHFFEKSSTDALVISLSKCYSSTIFLLVSQINRNRGELLATNRLKRSGIAITLAHPSHCHIHQRGTFKQKSHFAR